MMQLAATNLPVMLNGALSYSGDQMSFCAQMENFNVMNQQYFAQNKGFRLNSANLTVFGAKVETNSPKCVTFTYCLGGFLVFPLCFTCCTWWKKLVYPFYEIDISVYESLAFMIN